MNVSDENVTSNSAILKCELSCFSPKLKCALFNITANNTDVESKTKNTTGNVSRSETINNYPTQLITLTNLASDTTYNYCVYMTDMMEAGNAVCGNFTTDNIDYPTSSKHLCIKRSLKIVFYHLIVSS